MYVHARREITELVGKRKIGSRTFKPKFTLRIDFEWKGEHMLCGVIEGVEIGLDSNIQSITGAGTKN